MIQSRPRRSRWACFAAVVIAGVAGCATSPTGQTQLKLFPDSEMARMGVTAYQELKAKTPVSKNKKLTAYVTCVALAVTREVPSRYDWEVTLFEDKAVNAFALPGGKIGVYTGLLKAAVNQDQLAAVLGHEIAHVIADHGNARISAAYATQTGLQLAEALAGGGAASTQQSQLFGLLGLGAQVGILMPYGRGQESEADILGLQYMAKAGFDPRQSIALWKNMEKQNKNQPPEFLSTHPSHATRIEDLNKTMPAALQLYDQAQAQDKRPQCK